ncbi:MAG: ComEC/Rec2 family competence protein, partial [Propionivibrio sp.]
MRPILAFAVGVLLLQGQASLLSIPLMAGWSALALTGIFLTARFPGRLSYLALAFCCSVLGFCWAGGMATLRLADQLPAAWESRDIELTGVVASLPQRLERGERFEFDVEAVHTDGATVPRRILLAWYRERNDAYAREDALPDDADGSVDDAQAMHPGERWRFTVRLKRPHGNANPYGFDYEAWLLEHKLRATGSLRAGK